MSRTLCRRDRHSTIELQARVHEGPKCVLSVSNQHRTHQRAIFGRQGGGRDSGDLTKPPVLVQLHTGRARAGQIDRDRNQADCNGHGEKPSKTAIASNDFTELFQILGISDEVELLRPDESGRRSGTYVNGTHRGGSRPQGGQHGILGASIRSSIPILQRILARWAFKLCTAGGFTLPAFALADDGYLVLHNGNILCGSDWIPEWKAITSLDSHRMLVVRYPIRTKADLLPVEALKNSDDSGPADVAPRATERARVDAGTATEIADKQLRLEGTLTLHSETAKKNGGDYDFDWICLVEDNAVPVVRRRPIQLQRQPGKTPRTNRTRRNPRGGTWRRSHTLPKATPSAASRISRRRAWRQAGPILRIAARSNCRRRSTS